MSATVSSSYPFYLQQVAIYAGSPILIAGVVGNLLNIIVFVIVNIGQLVSGLMLRIVITGFGIDWTLSSVFLCKFRQYCLQVCALTSITCLCLSTIDQYLSTCSRPRWQQWSNIKTAHRLSVITIIFWLLHGICCLIYFNLSPSVTSITIVCGITNNMFLRYFNYAYTAVLTGYFPVFITILFGSMAYYNVRQLSYRIVPLVRRELDKQLSVMVLLLDIYNIIALMPYPIIIVLTAITTITNDPIIAKQVNFASSLTSYFYYLYFACPFYIYMCVSERFRRQLIYVLFKIHLEKCQRHRVVPISLTPH